MECEAGERGDAEASCEREREASLRTSGDEVSARRRTRAAQQRSEGQTSGATQTARTSGALGFRTRPPALLLPFASVLQ